jgi:hypothetical protein
MDFTAFRPFIMLGFGHITAPGAMDHILFLVALAAIYKWNEWRQALVVVTAFTVGHSITLTLAVLAPRLLPPSSLVEFLIPVTIVATGIENLLTQRAAGRRGRWWRRGILASAFGLVHGAGFAGYLSQLLPGSIGIPLLGFNIGLELGQGLVLCAAMVLLTGLDRVMATLARGDGVAFQLRVAAVSLLVAIMGGVWVVERAPW